MLQLLYIVTLLGFGVWLVSLVLLAPKKTRKTGFVLLVVSSIVVICGIASIAGILHHDLGQLAEKAGPVMQAR